MKSDASDRRWLARITPMVLAALVVVAPTTVMMARAHRVSGAAVPVAYQPTPTTSTPAPSTPTPSAGQAHASTMPAPDSPAAARTAVAAVDALTTSDIRYGVAILDERTGTVILGQQGDARFYAASVVKLFLVVDILHRREAGSVTLTDDNLAQIQAALSQSDDNAMDTLWEDFDGPDAINELIGLARLTDTALPDDPSQWGETLVSARDVVAVYQYASISLRPADHDLVMGALANASDTGADGFDQAFGLLNPPRLTGVRAKQGWMIDGTRMMLHTTGILGAPDSYVVALLSDQPAAIGWDAGVANVDTVSTALLNALHMTSRR